MSGGAGDIFETVASPITRPVGSFLSNVGLSDPLASTGAGAFFGNALRGPTGAFIGGALGAGQERSIRDARKQAEADEAARQTFNNEIFRLAQSLSGTLATDPTGRTQTGETDFSFEQLRFQGDDPRNQQLENLRTILTGRSSEITQRRAAPGQEQTRLSLLS